MAPRTIIIGGGVSGIAMAHTLKCKLGYTHFDVFEKRDSLGGTWKVNTYPGCGSDVPIHLYSFSFNLNPDWTQALADQQEILQYVEATVDKFQLREHFHFNSECLGAKWVNEKWHVKFVDRLTGREFTEQAEILITAVGGFSQPRDIKFPGIDQFQGNIFHTAAWDHSFNWIGKRVAVIGNGCSAAQVVPSIAPGVKKLTQYARSPQWYHERPNKRFSAFEKFCFRYIPLYQHYYRLDLFLKTDQLASVYGSSENQVKQRLAIEEDAKRYICREAPNKYHRFIIPDFPLGCKRRIYDPGYLASLHRENVQLLPEGIKEFTKTGIISDSGRVEELDAVILATGFQVQSFLTPMHIVGKTGESLQAQWDSGRGAQAYMGTFVHNYPNMGILFGPNTFPAFNSVIYAVEVQVAYIANVLIKPIVDAYADVIEIREDAEETFVKELDGVLAETVFAAGCSNWYINSAGRNSAAWPGLAATFWRATFFPKWREFNWTGGSRLWVLNMVWRNVASLSGLVLLPVLAAVGFWVTQAGLVSSTESARAAFSTFVAQLKL